jgi:vanillate O-demethylase monooxygenase subunit
MVLSYRLASDRSFHQEIEEPVTRATDSSVGGNKVHVCAAIWMRRRSALKNYPLNCWWVAATSEELTTSPIQRWLLDTPIALFRTEAGRPVALDDRCPHRWAPLSQGSVMGDAITCPYHGAHFGPDGKCSHFPAQKAVPSTMQVRSFPLLERGPYIWIWMGETSALQDVDSPPEFAWHAEPQWTLASGNFEFAANYFLLHENLLDLTHFNHVHSRSFGFENWVPSPKFSSDGNRVGFENIYLKEDLNERERTLIGLGYPGAEKAVSESWFETPALHRVTSTVHFNPDSVGPQHYLTRINHMVTPSNTGHSHYWWLVGTNEPLSDAVRAAYSNLTRTGYLEDKVVLEAIQTMILRDPRGESCIAANFGC